MINFIYYAIKALVSVNGVVTVSDNLLAAVCYQRTSKAAKDFIALFVFSTAIEFSLSQHRFAQFS